MKITYQEDGTVTIQARAFSTRYLGSLFKCKCAADLMPLFRRAGNPVKEWTESHAALHHLRRYGKVPTTCVHVGDGKHCRTGAMFGFMTPHENISVDPIFDQASLDSWAAKLPRPLERVSGVAGDALKVVPKAICEWSEPAPIMLTFVHAHVNTSQLLASLPRGSWRAAYTLACCEPAAQLVRPDDPIARVADEGEDWGVLSPERRYQVLVPR